MALEKAHDASEPIIEAVRASLAEVSRLVNLSKLAKVKGISVALSGGCDSVVLLHALHAVCAASNYATSINAASIHAITINHQLQSGSRDWAEFCARFCAQLGVTHQIDTVTVALAGQGIEGAARDARYESLRRLSVQADCQVLALGHHQDDQVETVLHQVLRGTGLSGASGMKALRQEPNGLWIWRPLLGVTRDQIEAYAMQNQLQWVDDPSNQDTHFARNALRQNILPMIDEHFTAGRKNIVRFAQLLAQSNAQIQEIALDDLNACRSNDLVDSSPQLLTLSVEKIQLLSPTRQAWLLRAWLKKADLKMPGQARLKAIQQQLVAAKSPAQVGIAHDGMMLRRYRDCLSINGIVRFESTAPAIQYDNVQEMAVGLPSSKLAHAVLEPAPRTLAQSFRLAANRPSRSLKLQFQAHAIAPWQRQQSAALYDGDDLLWVAGLGMNHQWVVASGDRSVPRLVLAAGKLQS